MILICVIFILLRLRQEEMRREIDGCAASRMRIVRKLSAVSYQLSA